MSVQSQISAAAARYGVPANLALAVAWRESRYNQDARGAAGEVGVFQLMPGTAGDLGVNPYSLSENIDGGLRYLREQYNRFGDWTKALWAYNAGQGNVSRGTVPDSTYGYAQEILERAGPLSSSTAAPWGSFAVRDVALPAAGGLDPGVWLGLAAAVGAWVWLRR